MTRDEAMAVMKQAFAVLSKRQRANLRNAAESEVRICCGKRSWLYIDDADGAG